MIKKNILIILSLILFLSLTVCSTYEGTSLYKNYRLIKKTGFNYLSEIEWYSISEYDEYGKLIKRSGYNPNHELSTYTIYIYEHDKVSKQSGFKKDNSLISYITYEYEGDSLVKESHFNNKEELLCDSTYKYDSNGNLIEEIWHNYMGFVDYINSYLYEYEEGYLVKIVGYDNKDNIKSEVVYKYNEKKQIIKKFVYWLEVPRRFHRDYYSVYEYDSNDNLIKMSVYDTAKDELNYYHTYKYETY